MINIKSKNKLLIIIIVILLINIIINYIRNNTLKLQSIKYKLFYKDKIIYNNKSKKIGTLYICSHFFGHVDVLLMYNIMKNKKCKFLVSENYSQYTFLYCNDSSRIINPPKSTNRIIENLEKGYDVVMFYTYFWNNTGIYYIQKKTNCNIKIVQISNNYLLKKKLYYPKIKNSIQFFLSTINTNYNITIKNFDKSLYENINEKNKFIKLVKKNIYNNYIYDDR